jgi:hypothetical protein
MWFNDEEDFEDTPDPKKLDSELDSLGKLMDRKPAGRMNNNATADASGSPPGSPGSDKLLFKKVNFDFCSFTKERNELIAYLF